MDDPSKKKEPPSTETPIGDTCTETPNAAVPDPSGPWQDDDELYTWATAIATSLEHWQADRLRREGPTCDWPPPKPSEEEERWIRAARDALAKLSPLAPSGEESDD